MKYIKLATAASLAALMGSLATAKAAEITVDSLFVPSANGFQGVANPVTNTGAVTANATGNTTAADEVSTGSGTAPSTASVAGNLISAVATGNNFTAGVDLELINDALATGANTAAEGIAVITRSLNTGVIGSTSTGNTLEVVQENFTTGSLENVDNLITAQTTLNRGSTDVTGQVPSGYAPTASGSNITFASGSTTEQLASDAAIATGSVQLNTDGASGSSATADGNDIFLTVTPTAGTADVSGSLALDSNGINSQFVGNTASSLIAVEAGTNPTFTGSTALSNVQANQGVSTTTDAQTNGNDIIATVGATTGSASNTLTGALSVSANTISASATGNTTQGVNGNAGNQFTLADSLTFDGISTSTPNANVNLSGGNAAGGIDADLALFNFQANDGGDGLTSETASNTIRALSQNLDSGSIALEGNAITSTARGNTGSNAIDAGGTTRAAFEGTAALASAQVNNASDTTATVTGSTIEAQVGNDTTTDPAVGSAITAGSVTLDANRVTANAIANQIGNSLDLGAADLTLLQEGGNLGNSMAVLTGGDRDNGIADSTAGASITNVQANFNSATTATNTNTALRIDAGDLAGDANGVDGSTLAILGGLGADIDAVAASLSASNSLNLSGNAISGSAGLNNLQVLGETATNNTVLASVTGPTVEILADTDRGTAAEGITGSNLEIRDVGTRALAYGTTANNTFNVNAGSGVTLANDGPLTTTYASEVTVNTGADDGQFFDAADVPTVTANFGLLSNQSATADTISAEITGTTAPYRIEVGDSSVDPNVGDVLASRVEVENNALSALAFGNQSTNDMDLDLGNVTLATFADSTYAPVANVTNVQSLGADTSVSSTINTGGAGFEAVVAYDVTDSTVSVSDNTTQAQAFGNSAAGNRLAVTGGDIVVAPTIPEAVLSGISLSIGDGDNIADAAFSVQNAQSGANSVSAGLDDGAASANMGSRIAIGGDVVSSNVMQDGNQFSATAVNNQAVNDLVFEDVTTLGATGGIANFQVVSSTTSASTGVAGTEPTLGTLDQPFSVSVSALVPANLTQTGAGAEVTLTGGVLVADSSSFSTDQIAALTADGWDYNSTSEQLSISASTLGTISLTDYTALFNGDPVSLNNQVDGIPPSDGDPASNAILTQIGGNSGSITDSTVSVSENMDMATTRANDAVNRLTASAVTLEPARGETEASASIDSSVSADADFALGNYQQLRNTGTTEADAAMTLGITVADPGNSAEAVTSDSSLAVDDNRQQADAIGNNAINRIDISGTNAGDTSIAAGGGVTSALASFQQAENGENVNASSWMEAYAPASLRDGSSLSISNNETVATGTVNRVDNASTVDVNTLAGSLGGQVSAGVTLAGTANLSVASASADQALLSQQAAGTGTLSTDATLRLFNQELNGAGDIGIVDSSVTMSGNTAQATGRANQANNLLSLSANTLGATGALANAQTSATAVDTTATGNISLQMNAQDTTGDVSALQASTVELNSNRVLAAAEGNRASNELALDASAGYGALTLSAANANLSLTSPQVRTAPFGLSSYQGNTGAIDADAEGGVLAEFASNEVSVVNDSTVTLNANVFDATASANVVSNLMEERAAAGGNASLALSSGQINEGAVTANAGTSTTPLYIDIAASGSATGTTDAIIVDSALAVLDNRMLATARGNTGSNVMDAQVGPQTTANTAGPAIASDDIAVGTSATYALFSGQRNTDSVTAGAVTEIGVSAETTNDLVVDSSSITLSGNIQQAMAVSNNIANTLMLSGTNNGDATGQGVTSSLASWQEQSGTTNAVAANSDLTLSAPAQLTDSTTEITNNASVAMAVLNEASNMASIDFTNLGSSAAPASPTQATLNAGISAYGTADNLVSNIQLANATDSTVSSTASLEAINQEAAAGAFANGVNASNIGIMGNVAQAQSVANLANSTLNLNADGNLSATGGVVNFQENAVATSANALGALGTSLDTTGTAITTLNGSSVRVDNNRVVATGVGNQATNVLNVTAGAGYQSPSAAGATASGATNTDALATASFAVLNAQSNTAGVTATVNGSALANFTGGFSPGFPTVDGSSLSVSGNRFAATATGNSATNLMTASTLPSGNAGMALTSSQVNSGAVLASANSVNIGVNTGGVGTQGSTTSIGGNAITASATGNVVSSRLASTSRF
ncbi:hypothetical protein [Halomonas alkaliantarctica]|uniref:hypothetical protein n=1 Tax=Halomonas alkaliantarctica TaxID=232346 RepID=UPI0004AB8CDD|nr:hypothetical protein [Halomonas alkaliantarctica]